MTKLWFFRLLPCVLAIAVASPLTAQEPLVTDRPDFTESAASVEPGRIQIEAGTTFESADGLEAWTVGEVLGRIGVSPAIELRVGVPSYLDVNGAEGFDDAFLGTKVELPGGSGWGTALLAGTTVPVGDADVAANEWQPEIVLALARDLSQRAGLGFNLGWGRPVVEGEREDEFLASAAVGYDLGDGWGAFGEAFGFATGDDAGPAFLDAGVTRLVGPDFQLDARVGAGLFQAAGEWFAGIGFSRRW
ncbi:MAG: transporter [Gemmatimonadota bacterium]|nr:transporter [Gemmatimonadota bacterium]